MAADTESKEVFEPKMQNTDSTTPGMLAIYALDPNFEYNEFQTYDENLQAAFDGAVARLAAQGFTAEVASVVVSVAFSDILDQVSQANNPMATASEVVSSQTRLLLLAYNQQEKRKKLLDDIADALMFTGLVIAAAGLLCAAALNPAAIPLLGIALALLTLSLALMLVVDVVTKNNHKLLQSSKRVVAEQKAEVKAEAAEATHASSPPAYDPSDFEEYRRNNPQSGGRFSSFLNFFKKKPKHEEYEAIELRPLNK